MEIQRNRDRGRQWEREEDYEENTSQTVEKNPKEGYKEKYTQAAVESQTKDLFDELPFRNASFEDEEQKLFACINYIPGIGPKLKASLKKGWSYLQLQVWFYPQRCPLHKKQDART